MLYKNKHFFLKILLISLKNNHGDSKRNNKSYCLLTAQCMFDIIITVVIKL